jgi:RNA polymerase sigma-70 factor (ECF subfamily)
MLKLSDEDVIERHANGIRTRYYLFCSIVFYRLVLKIAVRILRDPGEAEDVMQDVFFEIFTKAAQFEPAKGSAKTWVLQYAYHRSLSRRQYLQLEAVSPWEKKEF